MELAGLVRSADKLVESVEELRHLPAAAGRVVAEARSREWSPGKALGAGEHALSVYAGLRDRGARREEAIARALEAWWEESK